MSLQKMSMLKDAQQVDIDDYTAQAHFVRAFAHFTLFQNMGGQCLTLPKFLGPDDQWDIPRLSKHETLMKIAADFGYGLLLTMLRLIRCEEIIRFLGGAGHLKPS